MKKKTLHLYLNNLDKIYKTKKQKIFAGKWCFLDNELIEIQKKNYLIADDVWKKNQKFYYDYKLCKFLLRYLSIELGRFLNESNNLEKNEKYWKIILYPWLSRYIPTYLYRWRTVESVAKKYNQLSVFDLKINKIDKTPVNTLDFANLSKDDDEYNYLLFLEILKYYKNIKKKNIKFLKKSFNKKKNNIYLTKKNNFKDIIFNFIDKINYLLSKNNQIFFESRLLKKKEYLNLCFNFKLFPQLFFGKNFKNNDIEILKYNYFLRDKFKKPKKIKIPKLFKKEQSFIDFIFTSIKDDIPKCFVEGFPILLKNTNIIKIKPKLIFSGFNHIYNEIFKVWLGEYITKNICKFFICEHGGGRIYKNDIDFKSQEQIVNKFITYILPRNTKEIQLSPLKFINIKKINKKDLKLLAYVARPNSKYPYLIKYSKHFCELFNLKNILNLKENLNQKIFQNLVYLPSQYSLELEKDKIKEILGKKFLNQTNQFSKYSRISNLIVCAYPETAFQEAIYLRPTILIFEKSSLSQTVLNSKLIYKLLDSKLLFFNAKDASKHINSIWYNVDDWWNLKKVQSVIKEFKYSFCNVEKNSYNQWIKFIKNEKKFV